MPIYEYQCGQCGKISEFLLVKCDEVFIPRCKQCNSKKMARILSKVRMIHSKEGRMDTCVSRGRDQHQEVLEVAPKEIEEIGKRSKSDSGAKQEVYSYSEEELGEDLIPSN